jgi:hypothetical protein
MGELPGPSAHGVWAQRVKERPPGRPPPPLPRLLLDLLRGLPLVLPHPAGSPPLRRAAGQPPARLPCPRPCVLSVLDLLQHQHQRTCCIHSLHPCCPSVLLGGRPGACGVPLGLQGSWWGVQAAVLRLLRGSGGREGERGVGGGALPLRATAGTTTANALQQPTHLLHRTAGRHPLRLAAPDEQRWQPWPTSPCRPARGAAGHTCRSSAPTAAISAQLPHQQGFCK